jgi:hypothetical protein
LSVGIHVFVIVVVLFFIFLTAVFPSTPSFGLALGFSSPATGSMGGCLVSGLLSLGLRLTLHGIFTWCE